MAVKPPVINVMEAAARKAARGLLRDLGEVEQLQVSRKGPADFVSSADLRAEKTLLYELTKAQPKYSVLFEESGRREGEDASNRWIVDPLDGTTNFLHGIPHFAISIAHEQEGQIVASVVFEPVRDELFWAARGVGAYVNFQRMRVSARSALGESLIATGLPFRGKPKHPAYMKVVETLVSKVAGVRRFGSAALDLAWVAAGRFDGFWEYDLEPWDIAGGILLVREAGGTVSDIDGRDTALQSGNILATNGSIHQDLGSEIRSASVV